jgi:hypothetical protein
VPSIVLVVGAQVNMAALSEYGCCFGRALGGQHALASAILVLGGYTALGLGRIFLLALRFSTARIVPSWTGPNGPGA